MNTYEDMDSLFTDDFDAHEYAESVHSRGRQEHQFDDCFYAGPIATSDDVY